MRLQEVGDCKYTTTRLLGEGSAAWIYQVRDTSDGGTKVAKILKPESVRNPETLARFEDEYMVLRTLHHPSLPEVYDYGFTIDGLRYIIMEFVEGETLDDYHDAHPEDLWVILYQLCEVLTFIHSHDLLHQDIKPENILVARTTAFGEDKPLVMLMDFGLTYRRNVGMKVSLVGTPEYMAPEIIRGETPLTRSVDYYSLGVTLYKLVAGVPPFRGTTRDVLNAHLNAKPAFGKERLEYTELYGHIRTLMTKNKKARLDAFDDLRTSAINHVGGGIDELEGAYALAFVESVAISNNLLVREKLQEWFRNVSAVGVAGQPNDAAKAFIVSGERGSGKTRVVEELAAEAKLVGIETIRISDLLGGNTQQADIWTLISGAIHRRGVLVILDEWEDLVPGTIDLVNYIARRRELESVASFPQKLWFVVVTEHVQLDDILSTLHVAYNEVWQDACQQMSQSEYDKAVDLFRHRVTGQTDKHRMVELLRDDTRLLGDLVGTVRALLGKDLISSRAGNWKLKRVPYRIKHEYRVHDASAAASRIRQLGPRAQMLIQWLVCSNSYLYVSELTELMGCSGTQVNAVMTDLRHLRLLRVGYDKNGTYVGLATDQIRCASREAFEGRDTAAFHRRIIEVISGSDDFRAASIVAHQYRQIVDPKGYLKTTLPWIIKLRHCGEFLRSRWLSRQMLETIGEFELPTQTRLAYERLVLRRWIRAEYARGDAHEIIAIYQRHFSAENRRPPIGFVKYFGDAFDWVGRGYEILPVVQSAMAQSSCGSTTYLELEIANAGINSSQGMSKDGLAALHAILIEHESKLSEFNRLRLYKAIALVEEAIAGVDNGTTSVDRFERLAIQMGAKNELTVAYLIRANALFTGSQFDASLTWIKNAVRLATKAGLRHRLMNAYFLASAVYYERGEHARALRYLKKANDIAIGEGRVTSVCSYTVRLAMISEKMGQYGDALRYIRQAKDVSNRFALTIPATKARLFELDLLISIGFNDISELLRSTAERIMNSSHLHHIAYFEYIQGAYWRGKEWSKARAHFERAREVNGEIQYPDDEIRSAIWSGYSCLALGEADRAVGMQKFADNAAGQVDSLSMHAELATYRLAVSYYLRTSVEEHKSLLEECTEWEKRIMDVPARIVMNRLLFRCHARTGNLDRAGVHFNKFYGLIKFAMSSFRDDVQASRYFDACEGSVMLNEFGVLMRNRKGRGELV